MIEADKWFREMKARHEKDPKYWVEAMRFDFGEEVGRMMEERGVTRAELARRLGSSPAYVTRLFRAMFNPTLLTLAKVAVALDARVSLHMHPAEASTHWLDLLERPASMRPALPEPCWPREYSTPLKPVVNTGGRNEREHATSAA